MELPKEVAAGLAPSASTPRLTPTTVVRASINVKHLQVQLLFAQQANAQPGTNWDAAHVVLSVWLPAPVQPYVQTKQSVLSSTVPPASPPQKKTPSPLTVVLDQYLFHLGSLSLHKCKLVPFCTTLIATTLHATLWSVVLLIPHQHSL